MEKDEKKYSSSKLRYQHRIKVSHLQLTTDGSCDRRKMRAGIIIRGLDNDKIWMKRSVALGFGTSNRAEYLALIKGVQTVLTHFEFDRLSVYTDSQLVYQQLAEAYRTKNRELKKLKAELRELLTEAHATLFWHRRDAGDGPLADEMSKGLDGEVNPCKGEHGGSRYRSEMDEEGYRGSPAPGDEECGADPDSQENAPIQEEGEEEWSRRGRGQHLHVAPRGRDPREGARHDDRDAHGEAGSHGNVARRRAAASGSFRRAGRVQCGHAPRRSQRRGTQRDPDCRPSGGGSQEGASPRRD